MKEVEDLQELEEGERILFNDRSRPLKVDNVNEDKILIEGPQGGKYQIFDEEKAKNFLVSDPGDREYASYAKNLRKVGEWQETSKGFFHSETDASLKLCKNKAGFWSIEISGMEADVDIPKYGFSSREAAEEKIEELVKKNPEGR